MKCPKHVNTRPSASARWLACPGSAWVSTACAAQPEVKITKNGEVKFTLPPGRASSPDAAEGTMGHAYLASELTGKPAGNFLKDTDKPVDLPSGDIQKIKDIAQTIKYIAELQGFKMFVERKGSLTFKIKDSAGQGRLQTIEGTCDVILVNDQHILVLDYKHGAGIPVDVQGNPQLTLYGLIGLTKWPDRELSIGVIQPRGRGKGIDLWSCSPEYLNTFKESAIAAIQRVYDPTPTYNIGPWCEEYFCPGLILGACPAHLEKALQYAVGVQSETEKTLPTAYWLLDYVKSTEKIAKKVYSEALSFVQRGGEIPGWRLGKKAGNRRWAQPDKVADVFSEKTGEDREAFLQPQPKRKPIGIMDATRHPRLTEQDVNALAIKPTVEILVPQGEKLQLFDAVE